MQGVEGIKAGRAIEGRVSDGKIREREIRLRYSAPYGEERGSTVGTKLARSKNR